MLKNFTNFSAIIGRTWLSSLKCFLILSLNKQISDNMFLKKGFYFICLYFTFFILFDAFEEYVCLEECFLSCFKVKQVTFIKKLIQHLKRFVYAIRIINFCYSFLRKLQSLWNIAKIFKKMNLIFQVLDYETNKTLHPH